VIAMQKLLDRFMSKSRAEKARFGLDILFNLLLIILIYQVSNNCTFIVGANNTMRNIKDMANLSENKAWILDNQGNLIPYDAKAMNPAIFLPRNSPEPPNWNQDCACVNWTIIVKNCTS